MCPLFSPEAMLTPFCRLMEGRALPFMWTVLWTDLTERSPSTKQNGVEKPGRSLTEQGTSGLLRRCACSGCSEVTGLSTWPACPLMASQAASRSEAVAGPRGAGHSEVRSVFCCGLSDDQEQGREATSLLLEVGYGGISDEMEGWRGEREVEKGCQPRGSLEDVQLGLM